jgi:ribosomal protein S18 acetylase RimI-like enzyme
MLCFRAARASDAYAIAELMILAGDGMYEFLLEEIAPKAMLAGLIAKSLKQEENGGLSWRHCFVAEHDTRIVGMVNAFPAAWLENQEREMLPAERVAVLDPIDQVQEWESYLISGIAVSHDQRRLGIARRLLEYAMLAAGTLGFTLVSLNLWADNEPARAFFEGQRFTVRKLVVVPDYPGLGHSGGTLLMVREIAPVIVP